MSKGQPGSLSQFRSQRSRAEQHRERRKGGRTVLFAAYIDNDVDVVRWSHSQALQELRTCLPAPHCTPDSTEHQSHYASTRAGKSAAHGKRESSTRCPVSEGLRLQLLPCIDAPVSRTNSAADAASSHLLHRTDRQRDKTANDTAVQGDGQADRPVMGERMAMVSSRVYSAAGINHLTHARRHLHWIDMINSTSRQDGDSKPGRGDAGMNPFSLT